MSFYEVISQSICWGMKSHKTEKMEVPSAKSLEFLRKQSFREKNENFWDNS